MSDRLCVVLVQHRESSDYNDFIGKFYHFPKKYQNLLSSSGNIEFIYFEPSNKKGSGTYFGYGKLGNVFPDKRETDHFFAEIVEYNPFSKEVSFFDTNKNSRETGPSYNPQNSARKISSDDLDGICLDGGIVLNFTADAHLIRVLGEELIASEVVGVLELVKNAYDANAKHCRVRIENIPNFPPCDDSEYLFNGYAGPVVVIEDDGIGMDRNIIENGWLRPASPIKTSVKDRLKREKEKAVESNNLGAFKSLIKDLKKHHEGRIPLGEKGVGRFATHRLGKNVIITTKTAGIDYEYMLEIDWSAFESKSDNLIDLSSVGFNLIRQNLSREYGSSNSGTRLVIYGGRPGYSLTEKEIREINRSLLKLKSPSPRSPQDFSVVFECPQIKDLDETPINEEFDPAFSLDVLVDDEGYADFELTFDPPNAVPLSSEKIHKNKIDLRRLDLKDPKNWVGKTKDTKRKPSCGPFFLHVDVWYRSKPWIDGPNTKLFTEHLDNFGGISIYRDGLNVFPAEWGAEVDWLRLSKRHIKKGVNISYYNLIGQLEIEQTNNLELIDKTDRQGLLNNKAFHDLSTLTRNILLDLELAFTGKRDQFKKLTSGYILEPRILGDVSRQGARLIDRISDRYDVVEDASGLLEGFGVPEKRKERLINLSSSLKNMEKSLGAMQEVQNLLSEQAGYGLSIGVAVHEVAKLTSHFYNSITKMLKSGSDEATLQKLVDTTSSLKTELKRFGPMRAIRNEPNAEFNISKSIKFCGAVFERKFRKLGVLFLVDNSKDFSVYCRYGAVNQIISNLLDNSCYWLQTVAHNSRKITIKVDADARRLITADSGPDIDDSIRQYLFEPGYSLKIPPSGLGLYICKYYMKSMKGNIYVPPERDRINGMPGAHFVLDFSRVSEGKEEGVISA